jgi:hypothetical protein
VPLAGTVSQAALLVAVQAAAGGLVAIAKEPEPEAAVTTADAGVIVATAGAWVSVKMAAPIWRVAVR